MSFSISEFARVNRVVLIWTAFFALLYLMRAMFGLIFITFIMCFISHSLSRLLYRITKQRRKFLVITLYLIFLGMVVCFILFAYHQILLEARTFSTELPDTLKKFHGYLDDFSKTNPLFAPYIDQVKEGLQAEVIFSQSLRPGWKVLEHMWKYISWFFVAMIFSFLIMMDLPNLIQKMRRLRDTKIRVIYDETFSNIVRFAQVVGENFRAQIFISAINTVLTFSGLYFIGTGMIALLSIVVFCCGLIPVLGVLVSSVPICLVALNNGGLVMVSKALLLIVCIHFIEAYILNPRIVSSVMKINPVITLIILYIAHSIMGMWGMLLGVPISVYFFRQIKNGRSSGSSGGSPSASLPPPAAMDSFPPEPAAGKEA
ncbi:MAG: AI-2E family transporter [Deltaproteobacteria bacterium]|jgi:predicted PurR-regulated permease PerM|nr:AI-2E family transporter [Deltaproteobacteria bacterium]